jgi:SAM-dependent methyltransferase
MSGHKDLYKHAVYYDIAFSRDVSRAVDFITEIYRHYAGLELQAVLDLGCGPGYHARAFARRGLRAVGLDQQPEMLALARKKAAAEEATCGALALTWIEGDMRHFQLDTPVDVALCVLGGFGSLLSDDDVIRHLRSVAGNLSPLGLYIIDLSHPRDCSSQNYSNHRYAGQRDDIAVEIIWPASDTEFDLIDGVAHVEVEMRVNDHGQELIISNTMDERMLIPQDIHLLANLSGALQVMGWYGDFDLSQPLDDSPASRRMIAVLRKNERPISYLSPKLEARTYHEKGGNFGVFARERVQAGEVLIVWGGDIITGEQLAQLPPDPQRYTLQVEENLYMTSAGRQADYVNHSCAPNAGLSGQITLVAMCEIAPGEEVCYDYAMSDGSPYDEFDCICGAPTCRRRVTGNDWSRPELWERYAGYFSPYLQRRIDLLRC